MNRWVVVLLVAVPAAVIARVAQAPPVLVFGLATLGLVPLAGLIGVATEVLAARVGPRIGGLLNATFGNAAEIIIGLAALSAGLTDVVRATIAGSIVGNALLVLGTAMLVGGWKHGTQRFDARAAGQYAALLALVVIGLAIPSLLHIVGAGQTGRAATLDGQPLHVLSFAVSGIFLLCYGAYIAFSVFGLHAGSDNAPPALSVPSQAAAPLGPAARPGERLSWWWAHTLWLPLVVLAGVTAFTALISEILVGTIEPVAHSIGLSPFFVGLIVLPIVGNAAEHFTAITMAARNEMEISLAITAGSSIQIALLAAPILVFASPLFGHPLDLSFSILEMAIFSLVAALFAIISLDGESTWLEGLLLCAFYVILAIGTFLTPA